MPRRHQKRYGLHGLGYGGGLCYFHANPDKDYLIVSSGQA